ncbi:MAG: glycosyltransferase family 1 protein [Nanoarchaeota archaeon]
MRIVIDGRMYQESGIGRYIRNLLDNLKKLDERSEYFILHIKSDYDRLVYHSNFHKVLADFRWYGIKEQIKIPRMLNKLKPDLVHFPHFNLPLFYGGKFVVTIHDLIHQHFRMDRATTLNPLTYKLKQLGYNKVFQNAIAKAVKILVPSSYVKNLLAKEQRIQNEKIVVTYEAVDHKILSIESKIKISESMDAVKKFGIRAPFIFYVGNAHPHKNVEGLIKAFLQLKEKYPQMSLVLSGHDHYFWQRVKQSLAASPLKKDIIFTGYVSDEELVAFYKNASCFVMPSFEEGFGIPLLEAMACGCPVVSSNTGALEEVGGDAVVYFDPSDLGDMVDKIDKVLSNGNLTNELIKKGQKRVKFFSWEKLAKQTMEVYGKCELP